MTPPSDPEPARSAAAEGLAERGPDVNRWREPEWARRYLRERHAIPHRAEAFAVLGELLPPGVERVLDLGTGDGHTLASVLDLRPGARGVGIDFQPEMLDRARARFADDPRVELHEHDLSVPLPPLGTFDLVVSSFAIHHLVPDRQRALYGEVHELLRRGGTFVHVEHVASRWEGRHDEFLHAVGKTRETDDPSNKLVDVADHLAWLDALGFADAECIWKWRELAVLAARRPA